MTVSHARAILGDRAVLAEPLDLRRDAESLSALAQWAMRFSPIVAPDGRDGLLLDVAGCQRLFGGEVRLLDLLADSVEKLGFTARVAVADTVGCAWALARFGRRSRHIVQPGLQRQAISPLPVQSLRIDEETVHALAQVGVARVDELMRIPRQALVRRFGKGPGLRLDQALGQAWETIDGLEPVCRPQVSQEFAGPVKDLKAIELAGRELLKRLLGRLQRGQFGASQLELTLRLSDAPPSVVGISLSRPSRDFKHLWALLWPRLERANLGFGVDSMRLVAVRFARLPHEQLSYLPGDDAAAARLGRQIGELVDALANRFGPRRVTRVEMLEAHVPERSFRLRSALDRPARRRRVAEPAAAQADRPSLLLRPPEPMEVTTVRPDGPVVCLGWRGASHRVRTCLGPERLANQWWNAHTLAEAGTSGTRDYYKVQDEQGRWLWIFRDLATGRWFVQGIWS